jgi:hypothetical protein
LAHAWKRVADEAQHSPVLPQGMALDAATPRATGDEAEEEKRAAPFVTDTDVRGRALYAAGVLAYWQGDLDQAGVLSAEALAICRQKHYLTGAAGSLLVQALISWRRGQRSLAAAMAEEALALQHEAGEVRQYWLGLETCALIDATQGYSEQAAYLLGAAAAVHERIGMHRPMFWRWPLADDIMSTVAAAQAVLGEERWAAAFAVGQAMTPEEVVAKVLDKTMGR